MPRATVGSRFALTLAEMLVVLVILSVVAAIAVQSLAPVAEQARYDATKKTLAEIRRAIVGEQGTDTAITGFMADMGRPPDLALLDLVNEPSDSLALANVPMPSHGIRKTWRGPYLRIPVSGQSPLRDGWDRPVVMAYDSDFDPIVISRGETLPGEILPGFDGPIAETVLRSEWVPRSIRVHLYAVANGVPATPKLARVVVYSPGLSDNGAIEFSKTVPLSSDNNGATYEIPWAINTPLGEQFLTCGQRVVQVFDASDNTLLVTRYVLIRPNADHLIELHVAAQSSQQTTTTPPTTP